MPAPGISQSCQKFTFPKDTNALNVALLCRAPDAVATILDYVTSRNLFSKLSVPDAANNYSISYACMCDITSCDALLTNRRLIEAQFLKVVAPSTPLSVLAVRYGRVRAANFLYDVFVSNYGMEYRDLILQSLSKETNGGIVSACKAAVDFNEIGSSQQLRDQVLGVFEYIK